LKRLITILVVIALLSVNVFAYSNKDAAFSFDTPKGFTELDLKEIEKEENEMFLTLLGHSEESFKKYFQDNGVEYFALKGDNSAQIMVRTAKTEFTEALNNMSKVNDDQIKEIATLFLPKDAPYAKVQTNGTVYLQTVLSAKDSGGKFTSVTYITVKNGMLYTIVFNYNGTGTEFLDDSFNNMKNFKITDTSAKSVWTFTEISTMILLAILLIAALVFIVLVVISFIKDIKRKRKEDAEGEFKIKRRKF